MSKNEQAHQIKPLHGDWVYGLRIVPLDGERPTLIRRWYAMEFDVKERVSADIDPNHPGIHTAELFGVPSSYPYEPISLDEARDYAKYTRRFLLSMAASNLSIVTSSIGYEETRNVHVLPPSQYASQNLNLDIKMRDYEKDISNEELTKRHIGRVARAGGDVSMTLLPQIEMDGVFRHIVQDRTNEFNRHDFASRR
jgi:hypothetical protein